MKKNAGLWAWVALAAFTLVAAVWAANPSAAQASPEAEVDRRLEGTFGEGVRWERINGQGETAVLYVIHYRGKRFLYAEDGNGYGRGIGLCQILEEKDLP